MKKGHACRQAGFTLIEMLVVGGITAILFTVTVNVLFMSTKTAKRSQLESLISEQADWLMVELEKNLSKADISTIDCDGSGSSTIIFNDRNFGEQTIITCINGAQVASASANTAVLTSDEVRMYGCDSFFSCDLTAPLPVINIGFTMVAGNIATGKVEDYVTRSFKTTIVVRE